MMQRPSKVHYNLEENTSILFFPDGTTGEYSVRGSLCFPILVENPVQHSHELVGYALLACQDVSSKVVTVFEQRSFTNIDPIVEDNIIKHDGLARWFNMNWNMYFGRKYYFQAESEITRKYRLDVSRSAMIEPKPSLIEVHIYENDNMNNLIWQYLKRGLLRFENKSPLHECLKSLQEGSKSVPPAILALQLLLCGIDRYPYKKRNEGRAYATAHNERTF
jgi:hypothetical protein